MNYRACFIVLLTFQMFPLVAAHDGKQGLQRPRKRSSCSLPIGIRPCDKKIRNPSFWSNCVGEPPRQALERAMCRSAPPEREMAALSLTSSVGDSRGDEHSLCGYDARSPFPDLQAVWPGQTQSPKKRLKKPSLSSIKELRAEEEEEEEKLVRPPRPLRRSTPYDLLRSGSVSSASDSDNAFVITPPLRGEYPLSAQGNNYHDLGAGLVPNYFSINNDRSSDFSQRPEYSGDEEPWEFRPEPLREDIVKQMKERRQYESVLNQEEWELSIAIYKHRLFNTRNPHYRKYLRNRIALIVSRKQLSEHENWLRCLQGSDEEAQTRAQDLKEYIAQVKGDIEEQRKEEMVFEKNLKREIAEWLKGKKTIPKELFYKIQFYNQEPRQGYFFAKRDEDEDDNDKREANVEKPTILGFMRGEKDPKWRSVADQYDPVDDLPM